MDNDASPGLVNFLVPFRRSKIRPLEGNIYDLSPGALGTFDMIICTGLLYHLRYPAWGMKKLSDLLNIGGTLVLETALLDAFEDMPILFCPNGSTSPYDRTSPTFFNLAGLVNLLAAVGLEGPTILDRFQPVVYRTQSHFPRFAARFPSAHEVSVSRSILTAQKTERGDDLSRYFEETHTFHSSGVSEF